MAKNLLGKYVWLVDTIYKAGKISFNEINIKWFNDDMGDKPIPLRTFHKWRTAIEEMFGLVIENEKGGGYRYYIQNADEFEKGSMRSWLFDTLTVTNLMMDNMNIKNKILLEGPVDDKEFLPIILKALQSNKQLYMTYQSYWRDEANSFEVEPYCVKVFRQRWYLVGHSDKIRIYSLDRILNLKETDVRFDYPKDFDAAKYFDDCFGIIADQNCKVEKVKIKVSAGQANYLRDLALHQTQREDKNDEYSIFEMKLRPTFDFQQELLSMGPYIEVLEPKWFREDTADKVRQMWDKYKDDK